MSLSRLETRSSRTAIATVACGLVLLAALVAALLPASAGPPEQQALPENAPFFQDSTAQRRAHKVLLLGTVALAASLALSRRARVSLSRLAAPIGRSSQLVRGLRTLGPPAIIVLSLIALPKAKWAIIDLVAVGAFMVVCGRFGDRPMVRRVLGLALLAYAALLLIPGFLVPPDVSDSNGVRPDVAEVHYSIVVSEGDRLSRGRRLFDDVMPHYGFIEPFVLAVAQKARGLFDFRTHIRLVQMMQVLFCVAGVLGYWIWSQRRVIATALASSILIASAHPLHIGTLCPNQSGWRFAGLPLGLLLLLVLRRSRANIVAPVLGLALGGLLLFNPETGIVVGIAYATYVMSDLFAARAESRVWITRLATLGGCAAVLPLAFIWIFHAGLGYFPFPSGTGPSYALSRFASGYGGLKIYFGITWIVIAAHCVYEVLRAALSARTLDSRRRFRLSLAVATLVWFGYFANRPTPWNLWTYWFLYGFFVIDLARQSRLARDWAGIRRMRLSLGAAIVAMLIINSVPQALAGMRDNLNALRPDKRAPTAMVSGVRFPEDYARALQQRADFVRERSKQVPLYYFTSNTYLMPIVSGVVLDLPFSDPYVDCFTLGDFQHSMDLIEARRPAELLFDDPLAGSTGSPERTLFIARMKSRLSSNYRFSSRSSGWEIWRRAD